VTEPGDVLLGRAEIERAFTALGSAWPAGRHRQGVRRWRAAMAMAYDAARVPRNVDAAFKPHGIVLEEARKVGDDLGLPYWWLNEQASVSPRSRARCIESRLWGALCALRIRILAADGWASG
jgi:hypothetical protein